MEIRKRYIIDAPVEAVWQCLTDGAEMEEWGAGPASAEPFAGGAFSQWGGDIRGTNTVFEPGVRLEQEWFGGEWEHASKAVFTLERTSEGTVLELVHTDLPRGTYAEFDLGWDEYYLGPLRERAMQDAD
jgi:uncharacterized protein YndB with AHSA1/START domain